jgi:DNA repair protein RadC
MEEKIIDAEFKEEMELKVGEEVLKQLHIRKAAIESLDILKQMAQNEFQNYVLEQFKQLGLDEKNQYSIHETTGVISVIKLETLKK